MTRRLSFKKRHPDETPEDIIEEYLNYNGPSYFGGINTHLKKMTKGPSYSNKDRSGLSHALRRMQQKKRIRKLPKDNEHIYPRYASLKQSTFDNSIDGYLLSREMNYMFTCNRQDLVNDIIDLGTKTELSDDETFILQYIHRFGFMMMYLLLSSYSRPINPKETTEKNIERRESWLNNALNFNTSTKSEAGLFDLSFKSYFQEDERKDDFDENIFDKEVFNDQYLRDKISHMHKILTRFYPRIIKNMKEYEKSIEGSKSKIKEDWLSSPQEKLPIRES